MTETNADTNVATVAARGTLTPRTISRKLLARKAAAKAGEGSEAGEALEDAFPAGAGDDATIADDGAPAEISKPDSAAADEIGASDAQDPAVQTDLAALFGAAEAAPSEQPEGGPQPAAPASAATTPATTSAWSSEDERALQAMLARRKAAGYQRRGKDVSAQLIRAGDIAPNPDTVVATIVALVRQAGGQLARGALLNAMAGAAYAHPKAQPGNRGWCQGYVAGALRDGFLAQANEAACGAADGAPCASAAVLA